MSFAYPHLLFLLLLPWLLLVLAYGIKKNRTTKWQRLVAHPLFNKLVTLPNKTRQLLALLLALLGFCCLIFALARPQWGEKSIQEFSRGRNLIIALDISRSMLTRDVQPSRLEQAKTATFDLLEALPEDKIGLILFSGEATLVVPLTLDHNAIKETLEQARYGWVSYGGTNFNDVLKTAFQAFDKIEGTHALVIISDGETTQPLSSDLVDTALEQHLIVLTAGIGTSNGDTIPDTKSPDGLYRDRQGNHIISKFNPESLQEIAKETKGTYISLSSGASIDSLVKDVTSRLDEKENGSSSRLIKGEYYAPFLLTGLILLLAALLISSQWTKKQAWSHSRTNSLPQWLLAFFSLALFSPSLQAQATAVAPSSTPRSETSSKEQPLYKELDKEASPKDKKELKLVSTRELFEPSDSLEKQAYQSFRKADNAFSAKNYPLALSLYSEALLSSDKDIQAAAHYNLANTLVEQTLQKWQAASQKTPPSPTPQAVAPSPLGALKKEQRAALQSLLEEALQNYAQTLKVQPKNKDALTNQKIAQDLLQKLKEEEQQQQEQNKDQQNQDQNKDQQKSDQNKDQQDKSQDQQNKDQQENKDQQKSDQNKDQQNQKDQSQDQQKNQDQQDKQNKDQQKSDQNKDQQDQQDKSQDQQNKDQQDQQNKDQKDQSQESQKDAAKNDTQNSPEQQNQDKNASDQKNSADQKQQEPQDQEPSDSENSEKKPKEEPQAGEEETPVPLTPEEEQKLNEKEARRILRERADIEKGNPFPYRSRNAPPAQDW